MNEITIFWIEDNPIQTNNDEINGKEYPKLLHKDFFSYCIFQHPKQVEEYLLMIDKLNGRATSLAGECHKALPDIIVFDYQLAQAISGSNAGLKYMDNDHYEYLKSTSASHQLKNTFKNLFEKETLFLDTDDVRNELYKADKFKAELKAEEILSDDEFGLYCGITILREFKEYITVGVPATINKVDKKRTMSYNSLFYEWINSYDLKGAIERPAKKEEMKDWAKILNFSADLLRKRIETQIQTGKATPDYSQLNALAEGNIPDERIFSFETIYGKRDLSLDGLFIDKSNDVEPEAKDDFIQFVNEKKKALAKLNSKKEELGKANGTNDEEKKRIKKQLDEVLSSISELNKKIEALENFNKNERNIEIWRFANTILSRLPISLSVIKKANETATTLWNTYLNEFEDRIVLSDYSSRNGSLNATETAYLEEVKKRLGVNSATGLIANECSIQTLLTNKATSGVDAIRLTTLITLTKATIELEKQRVESGFSEKYPSFTKYEYLDILYPKANFKIPLLLSMNVETDKDGFTEQARSWLSNNLTDKTNKVTIGNIFKIENWILKGEKEILKSLFYKDSKYYPQWIK